MPVGLVVLSLAAEQAVNETAIFENPKIFG
jgi:hypothetical protein